MIRVEVAGGFVGEDHFGAGDHGAGDADELLLTTGELVGVEVLFADDVEAVEGVGDDAFALGAFVIAVGERDLQVFVDGEVVEQVVALEDEAEVTFVKLAAVAFVEGVNGMVEEVVLTGPIGVVHADEVEERGFAGPGRSHDGEEFAFADLQIYTA